MACYILGQNPHIVHINRCFPARDDYIIRGMEDKILASVKPNLIALGHVREHLRLCLTPVDDNLDLSKESLMSWEEIKNGKFMIINGQHSLRASKDLQVEKYDDKCQKELRKWEAYIVWTLDKSKLVNISVFCNSTNHLDHAQLTWGSQIISSQNVWVNSLCSTLLLSKPMTRQTASVLNAI